MKFATLAALAVSLTTSALWAAPRPARRIDADDAYKNNCMRCHTALPQSSPRMSATIMMHMRTVANLPGDEAEAVLRYLRGDLIVPVFRSAPVHESNINQKKEGHKDEGTN